MTSSRNPATRIAQPAQDLLGTFIQRIRGIDSAPRSGMRSAQSRVEVTGGRPRPTDALDAGRSDKTVTYGTPSAARVTRGVDTPDVVRQNMAGNSGGGPTIINTAPQAAPQGGLLRTLGTTAAIGVPVLAAGGLGYMALTGAEKTNEARRKSEESGGGKTPNPNDPPASPTATRESTSSDIAQQVESYLRGQGIDLATMQRMASPEAAEAFVKTAFPYITQINAQADAAARFKMREKSRREEVVNRINAWRDVEKQAIASNAQIATSLAQTAYIAATPNANVLSALSLALRSIESKLNNR